MNDEQQSLRLIPPHRRYLLSISISNSRIKIQENISQNDLLYPLLITVHASAQPNGPSVQTVVGVVVAVVEMLHRNSS